MTIPANIDYRGIVQDLMAFGYGPDKIDTICGFSERSVAHLLADKYRDMTYQRAARLYNFWWDERQQRGLEVLTTIAPLFGPENNPALVGTT